VTRRGRRGNLPAGTTRTAGAERHRMAGRFAPCLILFYNAVHRRR
jgi:hypothetical protein